MGLKIYTEKELAIFLDVSPWTVRLWRLQSGLPYFRTAGRIFYRIESVLNWMDLQEQKNMEAISISEKTNGMNRIAQ